MRICSRKLTRCRVLDGGEIIELGLLDDYGTIIALQLPFDQAESVIMTLPSLLTHALHNRTGKESSRYVFPLGAWSIEIAEHDGTLIVTLQTRDGFDVSFGVPFDICRPLATALLHAADSSHA